MYFLYTALTVAAMIVLAPYFVVQGLRRGKYLYGLRQRLGYYPRDIAARAAASGSSIWVHAVSVGEVLAAKPLVQGLKKRLPGRLVFLSTTTATGQRVARERVPEADGFFYFPLDWPGAVRRAFQTVNPALVAILETEIWPNFLREARRRNLPVVFVNGRISARSFARYVRFRPLIGNFWGQVMGGAEAFLAQSAADADRLRAMGAPPERITVAGNLKYDIEPPPLEPFGNWLRQQTQQQERWPVVIAGSVVPEEEQQLLAAYDIVQRQWRRALLILAPRKPDRFGAAETIIAEAGWEVIRRSRIDLRAALDDEADVLLLDSIGELGGLYALADAVFVGGSLVSAGGHNILEPAWFSLPPIFGPSMENFREIAVQFLSAGAALQVSNGEKLGKAWVELIGNTAKRQKMGQTARALVERNRGATARSLERLASILEDQRSRR